jgi:hypothetical protein
MSFKPLTRHRSIDLQLGRAAAITDQLTFCDEHGANLVTAGASGPPLRTGRASGPGGVQGYSASHVAHGQDLPDPGTCALWIKVKHARSQGRTRDEQDQEQWPDRWETEGEQGKQERKVVEAVDGLDGLDNGWASLALINRGARAGRQPDSAASAKPEPAWAADGARCYGRPARFR